MSAVDEAAKAEVKTDVETPKLENQSESIPDDKACDEMEEVTPEDEKKDVVAEEHADESSDVIETIYAGHGGDPRTLELGKCLLVSKLPSSFLADSFEVFTECVYEMLSEEFNVSRDAMEKVIRVPKLQPDAESQDNALRAIVMFKSRVHKHRVFAQKKVSGDGSIGVSSIDEIPKDMLESDYEIADEIGEEEDAEEHMDQSQIQENQHQHPEEESNEDGATDAGDVAEEMQQEEHHDDQENDNDDKGEAEDQRQAEESKSTDGDKDKKGSSPSREHKKKAYVDEDAKAPYEVSWDGAPEFQWKLCTAPGDTRRLTLENIFRCDLQNPFIYRVMARAETVDISFPMRYNLDGNKQMYGKITLMFAFPNQIISEAMSHLIYVRCSAGRRIKVYIPQTPFALKQKDDFESRLGRTIQPTPRMHQLVVKVLPKDCQPTLDDAKEWFPEQADKISAFEIVEDEILQPCALVTFADVAAVQAVHSSTTFITYKDANEKEHKLHCFLRGVEAHFGSLLTRWDSRKVRELDSSRPGVKRPSTSAGTFPSKKPRGSAPSSRGGSSRGTPRGSGGGGRGSSARVSSYAPSRQDTRSGRGGRANSGYRGASRGSGGYETPSPRTVGSSMRSPVFDSSSRYSGGHMGMGGMDDIRIRELELQQQMLRQQEMLETMQARLRSQERHSMGGGSGAMRDSYGSGYGYSNNSRDSYGSRGSGGGRDSHGYDRRY